MSVIQYDVINIICHAIRMHNIILCNSVDLIDYHSCISYAFIYNNYIIEVHNIGTINID